jgi:hypothetical protein
LLLAHGFPLASWAAAAMRTDTFNVSRFRCSFASSLCTVCLYVFNAILHLSSFVRTHGQRIALQGNSAICNFAGNSMHTGCVACQASASFSGNLLEIICNRPSKMQLSCRHLVSRHLHLRLEQLRSSAWS